MYCKQCGNEVAEGAKFCESCGTPIDQVEEAKRQTQQEQPTIVINNNVSGGMDYPYKNKWVAFALCLLLGLIGAHRFYVGKIGTGIIWLLTGGCFGIGWIVDLIMILVDSFRDKAGFPLK
ncbi:TM2 domain-containing protein [Butyricicoccus pullicaecorum]|uniref:TM2 domain-containing protein n=1 Tax=Butyricicoccus pullicaecorum TaxID=501571 RepID=A0A1Y4LVH1_9FIRM|nr:TM2 domain-containing protein [Butyricicoccus pullicaecorum]OUP59041.1 hypothetical protein B5F15_06120 [Butyricicoccus pullicaecorum]